MSKCLTSRTNPPENISKLPQGLYKLWSIYQLSNVLVLDLIRHGHSLSLIECMFEVD